MSVERLIAERLVRNRMKESSVYYTQPDGSWDRDNSEHHKKDQHPAVGKKVKLLHPEDSRQLGKYTVISADDEYVDIQFTPSTTGRYKWEDVKLVESENGKVQERMSYEDDIIDKVEDIALDDLGPIKNLELMPSQVQGYNLYRCIAHKDNKGHWYAEKDGDIFAITYAQALGEEDIVPDRMRGLRQKLGRMLLPNHMQESTDDEDQMIQRMSDDDLRDEIDNIRSKLSAEEEYGNTGAIKRFSADLDKYEKALKSRK